MRSDISHQSYPSPDLSRHACGFLWEQWWGKVARHSLSVIAHCPVDLNSLNHSILGTNLCSKWLTNAFCTGCTQNGQAGAQLSVHELWFAQTTFASVAYDKLSYGGLHCMCVVCIPQLQGVSLQFADHYKFCSCAVALERFVFFLKEEPNQKNNKKKILLSATLSSQANGVFPLYFLFQELWHAVVGEVPVSALCAFLLQARAVQPNRGVTRGG